MLLTMINKILFSIRVWTSFILILILFSFIAPFALVILGFKAQRLRIFCHYTVKFIFILSGCQLKIVGAENLSSKLDPVVYVSNHQSLVDILVFVAAIPSGVCFVAKDSLKYTPLLGWCMWIQGHIFIKRESKGKSYRKLDQISSQVKAGKSVLFFPEGTRSKTGEIAVFKRGAFEVALRSGVKLIPCFVSGTGSMLPKHSFLFRRSELKVYFDKPIDIFKTKSQNNTSKELSDLAYKNVLKIQEKV